MDDRPDTITDEFPAAYARTQRFSSGVPRNFSILPPLNTQAIPGSGRILFLRAASVSDPTLCLWSVDLSSLEESLLVDPRNLQSTALTSAEKARRERTREAGSGIVAYSLDSGKTKACFTVGGDLVVADLNNGTIETPAIDNEVFDPRLSPDGHHIAYVAGDSLRVLTLHSPNSDRVLIADSVTDVCYGRADFVAAEEMGRSRGFWWSPCSKQVAVTKVDKRLVNKWWVGDPAHPGAEPSAIHYPQAGSRNTSTGLLLIDVETGASRPINWDADGHYEYLANVVWPAGLTGADGSEPEVNPIVVRQTRDQQEVSIVEVDTSTLKVRTLETILDDVWVELIPTSPTICKFGVLTIEDLWTDTPHHTSDQRSLVLNGNPVTGEGLNVRSIVGSVGNFTLISASSEPTEIHIYSVNLGLASSTGTSVTPQPLTTVPGVHSAVIGNTSSMNATALITSAVPETPGSITSAYHLSVIEDPENGVSLSITGPSATIEDLRESPPIATNPLFINLGVDELPSVMFLPQDYDGSSQLPVLLDPYGGPHGQRVLKYHNGHLVSQWFANQGYAVLVTDGSGTPGRGPKWERRVWGDLAAGPLEDQLNALDAAAARFDGLDLNRVGIRGWSFGGYLAALAVLRRPDRIHAAVAGAPVTTWRLYDTHYTERYLGHPEQHPHHYEQTDLIAEANKLTRPLLLIQGLADDNVVAAHTLRFSSALLAAGRPHQVLPLSGVTHMTPQQSVAENLLRIQLSFLNENVRDRSLDNNVR